MKKVAFSIIMVLFTGNLFAQDVEIRNFSGQEAEIRRGYIGISFGPAFPTGDIKSSAVSEGGHFNLVNFGYLFSEHVGIAATWFGTSFISKADKEMSVGMGGIMAGPLFSTATPTRNFEFDFKPMVGFANGTIIDHGDTSSSSRAFALGIGGAIRWNCWSKFSLSCGIDYYSGKPEGVNLSSCALVFGVNYRLK